MAPLADLFAAVYDDPHDDAPRMVLADALMADNDPRGEFIQLQLLPAAKRTPETRAREHWLLAANLHAWRDGIPTTTDHTPEPDEFRRGFLAHFTARQTFIPASLNWSTIEHLHLPFKMVPGWCTRLLAHRNLAGVTSVSVAAAALSDLQRPRAFARLEILGDLAPLPAGVTARAVEVLAKSGASSVAKIAAWLGNNAIGTTCTELVLAGPLPPVPTLVDWFTRTTFAKLATLRWYEEIARFDGWVVELARAATTITARLRWLGTDTTRPNPTTTPSFTAKLPAAFSRDVVIEIVPPGHITKPGRAQITRALARDDIRVAFE